MHGELVRTFTRRQSFLILLVHFVVPSLSGDETRVALGVGKREGGLGIVYQRLFELTENLNLGTFGILGIALPTAEVGVSLECGKREFRAGASVAIGQQFNPYLSNEWQESVTVLFSASPELSFNAFDFDIKVGYSALFQYWKELKFGILEPKNSIFVEVGYFGG